MPELWNRLKTRRTWIHIIPLVAISAIAAAVFGCGDETTTPMPGVTITAVDPAEGPLSGGTPVTITGTNFIDVTGVTLGGAPPSVFVVRSSTEITAYTPPVTDAEVADVVVTSRAHATGSCAGCFTYYDPRVTIAAVSPDTGPLPGGTAVTISGTGFVAVTSVTIGGVPLGNPTTVSFTEITGTTAARVAPGAVDVAVVGSGGSATCAGCFTYQLDVEAQPLAAGGEHTCALSSAEIAYCWGRNALGTLGDGSNTDRAAPVPVAGGLRFRAISAGEYHTCALTSAGVAYCWGNNTAGQLGNDTYVDSNIPVAVGGGLLFSTIAAGSDGYFTCGIARSGAAYCWGQDWRGQLGSHAGSNASLPRAVTGGLDFRALDNGDHHTCALTLSAEAFCWGENSEGQVGDGTSEDRWMPVAVSGGLQFSLITAGGLGTCALTTDGVTYCWGSYSTVPATVIGDPGFAALTRGGGHVCGITGGGEAFCWGNNFWGQLGDSSTTPRATPVPVRGGLSFSNLSAARSHTCGLTTSGEVYCWGANGAGQLGNGTIDSATVPVAVLPFGGSP